MCGMHLHKLLTNQGLSAFVARMMTAHAFCLRRAIVAAGLNNPCNRNCAHVVEDQQRLAQRSPHLSLGLAFHRDGACHISECTLRSSQRWRVANCVISSAAQQACILHILAHAGFGIE